MPNPCIFCGNPGGSGEHLWSKKLGPEIAKHLPKDHDRSYRAIQSNSGLDDLGLVGMPLYATKIECVCHRCNNEWMNRLDERTREKTIALVHGQGTHFDEIDTIWLASWLAMKMMVRDQFRPNLSVYSNEHHKNFYLTGLPPQLMWIGIAKCKNPIWSVAFQRQFRPVGLRGFDQPVRQAIYTMGLGNAVAFAEFPLLDQFPCGVFDRKVTTIWPNPRAFRSADIPTLRSNEVRAIAMRFDPLADSASDVFGRTHQAAKYKKRPPK